MIITWTEIIGLGVVALVAAIAGWRGGPVERRVAAVLAGAWLLSILVDRDGHAGVQWGIFAVDALFFVYLLAETVSHRRLWPAAAAGLQLFVVMTHVAFVLDFRIEHWGFFSAYSVWSYAIVATVLIGVLTAPEGRARRRRPSPE